jgi:hypothetical protein
VPRARFDSEPKPGPSGGKLAIALLKYESAEKPNVVFAQSVKSHFLSVAPVLAHEQSLK